MTTNNKPIPTMTEAYATTPPNELEKHLAAQQAPGYIPPGWEGFIMNNLPPNHPLVKQLKEQQINGAKEGNA